MSKTEKIIIFTIFGIIIYFPIFLHLDYGGLYRWDEASNALHAYDMLEHGRYLRRFFLGTPETWETKPPMLVWLQAISMKLFGYNELAIRLPSALAVLFTVVLIVRFFIRELKDLWGGIFSGLVLLTSAGYIRGHVSRTGDHDALLIFFLVTGLIYFYKYLNNEKRQSKKHLLLFVVALIGGVLTKSIAGLYYAPGLLIFTIISKKFIPTVKQGQFWLGVLGFITIIGSYYLVVEYFYPGYLDLVWENELFPRFFNSAIGHDYNKMPESFHFTKILFRNDFKWYIWFIPLSLFLIWIQKNKALSKFSLLVFITALIFHYVSSNGTYNSWYNAAIFPLLAMIVGAGISIIFNSIKTFLALRRFQYVSFALLFTATIFFLPYQDIILNQCYFKEHWANDDIYGEYFKKLKKEQPELKDFFVYYEVENRHFLFYRNVYNDHYGYNIRSCGAGTDINRCSKKRTAKVGDKVMICNKNIKRTVKENFKVASIGNYKDCELYLVKGVLNTKE
jgi:4-amino-4-deoxy-L-arabinose transferase-like glycosyltransferase